MYNNDLLNYTQQTINDRLNGTDWNEMNNLSANDAYIYFHYKLQSIVISTAPDKMVEITKHSKTEILDDKRFSKIIQVFTKKVQKTNQTSKRPPLL